MTAIKLKRMNLKNSEKLDSFIKSALLLAVASPLVLVLILARYLSFRHLQSQSLDITLGVFIGICVYNILKASLTIYKLGKEK